MYDIDEYNSPQNEMSHTHTHTHTNTHERNCSRIVQRALVVAFVHFVQYCFVVVVVTAAAVAYYLPIRARYKRVSKPRPAFTYLLLIYLF